MHRRRLLLANGLLASTGVLEGGGGLPARREEKLRIQPQLHFYCLFDARQI